MSFLSPGASCADYELIAHAEGREHEREVPGVGRVFFTCVRPIGTFSVEVWGYGYIGTLPEAEATDEAVVALCLRACEEGACEYAPRRTIMGTQITAAARPVRRCHDLAQLRERRDSGWNTHGGFVTIAATAPDGSRVSITTNCVGDGEFSEDGLRQYTGTCQFSIRGWSDRRARAELRERYEEMVERKVQFGELARFEREFDAECGIKEV